jgi:hypothetical protein
MMLDMRGKCSICDELCAASDTRFTKALGNSKIRNAIFSVSERFAIIPSLGALSNGHSLLVTRDHTTTVCGGVDSTSRTQFQGHLQSFMKELAKCDDTDFELLCFEHGDPRAELDQPLCSTVHGHLHLLPLQTSFVDSVYESLEGLAIPDIESPSSQETISKFSPYLLVFRMNRICGVRDVLIKDAAGLPSQYMRQLVARVLNLNEWDWRAQPATVAFKETLAHGFRMNQSLTEPVAGDVVFLSAPDAA